MSKNIPPIKEPIYTGNVINRTWVRFFQGLLDSSQSSNDTEAIQHMEHESDGKISDLEKMEHDTLTMLAMAPNFSESDKNQSDMDKLILMQSVDMNEIMKMKNDLETMMYMGGN